MASTFKPRIVEAETKAIDITKLLRAEIIVRDWPGVHVAADRRQPIEIEDAPKRGWLK